MILYKFFAIAFLILTPIFAFIIHRFFSLKYLGLNFADLTFPLYFIEVVAVSARFFTHSFLPYITILLSLAAIIITIQMLSFLCQNMKKAGMVACLTFRY